MFEKYVWKFIFPSGTVSVARHSETYGSEDNLFEVALYKGNKMLSYGEIKKTFNLLFASTSITAIKDEILTLLICGIFIFTFLPFSQPYMTKGFEILKSAPTEFWWAVLIVFSGSFGMSTLKNIKKK